LTTLQMRVNRFHFRRGLKIYAEVKGVAGRDPVGKTGALRLTGPPQSEPPANQCMQAMTHDDSGVHPVGLWLVPGQSEHAFYAGLIDAWATEFDAPRFEPHVTLYAGVCTAPDRVEDLAGSLGQGLPPVTLVVRSMGHSAVRFKTLYLEFEPNARLSGLSAAFASRLAQPADYTLRPHLSLLYKELGQPQREALARRVSLVGQSVRFDQLALVRPGRGQAGWEEVAGWEVWWRLGLSHPT
jgi:2'-5' RNA ligase